MRLLKANSLFVANQREISAALVGTFLAVSVWYDENADVTEPLSLAELADRLNLPASTVYRHLSYKQREGVEGMGWVEVERSPYDGRRKWVRLTEDGKAMVARLLSIVQ